MEHTNSSKLKVAKKRLDAFSLLEVLIVLVIIGILVLLALPDQTSVITKAKATEAKIQLQQLHALERANFFEYGSYTDDLKKIGFEQSKLVTDGGNAYYLVQVEEFTTQGFIGTATSVVDFDGDGTFNVWMIDQDKNLQEKQPD